VAERLGAGDRAILGTTAGTGVVTRAMAAVRPDSCLVATELNQAMLDVAAATDPPANVAWRQADAHGSATDLSRRRSRPCS
jgi:trans-aconitate methyltransferase